MNRMKKHILFGGMLLCAAAFTACSEDFTNWADPQSNAQGESEAAYSVNFGAGSQANVVMDKASETVQLVSLSAGNENVTGFKLKSVTVNGVSIDAELDGNNIVVNSAKLDSIIELKSFDRSATAHAIEVKTEAAAKLASGEYVPVEGTSKATLTPYTNTPSIDPNGYCMLGDWQGWNNSNPTRMTEVEPGVFQAVVTTTSESSWFKFYRGTPWAESATPDWGVLDLNGLGCAVNGDDASPNLLVWYDDPRFNLDWQAKGRWAFETPTITGAATYVVTLDMNKLYYKYELLESVYYVVGTPNGWSDSQKTCAFYPLGNNAYSYTTNWANQWSLKIWDIDDFGNWDACWGGVNGSTDATAPLVNKDAGAFGPSENGGWYTLTIDMNAQTYTWAAIDAPTTEYANITLIGGFNSWSPDGEIELSQVSTSPHNWYVLQASFASDTELKFRANHDWGVNWGTGINVGDTYGGTGVNNGDNIKVPAGTYDVYFNDITGQFAFVAKE